MPNDPTRIVHAASEGLKSVQEAYKAVECYQQANYTNAFNHARESAKHAGSAASDLGIPTQAVNNAIDIVSTVVEISNSCSGEIRTDEITLFSAFS
jgi:translation initiation factor 2 alpha subunit (eIF-2alpha)